MRRFCVPPSMPGLAASLRIHAGMFGAGTSVVMGDDATGMLDEPRVTFAISKRGGHPGLDQHGLRADSPDELALIRATLDAARSGAVVDETGAYCRYAVSDRRRGVDPIAREALHTLDTIPVFPGTAAIASAGRCRAPEAAPTMAGCCEPATAACREFPKAGAATALATRFSCGSTAEAPSHDAEPAARGCCA